jgi:CheY-like chemotaxis protein
MHNPRRILIADDNETNRDILRTRLRQHGYELIEAGDRPKGKTRIVRRTKRNQLSPRNYDQMCLRWRHKCRIDNVMGSGVSGSPVIPLAATRIPNSRCLSSIFIRK